MPEGYKNFSKTKPMQLEHFAPVTEWWNNRTEIQVDGFDKAKKYSVQELADRNYNIDLCGFPHEEEEILPPKELIQQYQEKRASLNADIDRILKQITGILDISDTEDLSSVIKYEQAETQLAKLNTDFPKALKKSILQEAVQGRLVPQNPNDEPASVLLERIKAEKQELIRAGKIKKDKKKSDVIKIDEVPFDIPGSWEWIRWGNISQSIQYGYNAPAKKNGRIKMVRISDIHDNKVLWDDVPYCDIEDENINTYLLQCNDILFARTGGIVGKSYLVRNLPEQAIYAGYLIRTRYSNSLCPES